VSVGTGLDMLEANRWIDDFPKVRIYFSGKEGNWLYDLVVLDYSNPLVDRMIRASKALVTSEGRDVTLDLYGMTVDPLDENHPGMMRVSRYQYTVKNALAETKYTKKGKDFRYRELVQAIRDGAAEEERVLDRLFRMKARKEWADLDAAAARAAFAADKEAHDVRRSIRRATSKLKVELAKRFVFAAASLCFVLVGIPLGIRAQRKESSVGMAISLAISLGYYLVVMLMLSLQKNYTIHPEWLIWLPVLACFVLAARFTRKNL
jgi:lipopolysaccharide export system permease protein